MEPPPVTEIGIWGSYHYGNFGDDLMAELFARQIRKWGWEPVVFSGNPRVVPTDVAQVRPDLMAWKGRVLVMGGGAMLSSDSLLEYWLRPATRAVKQEFDELLRWCRARSGRVIPISIGGEGTGQARVMGARRALFAGPWAPAGTVRLKGDMALMNGTFGKEYRHYPDVLFATPRLMDLLPQAERRNPPEGHFKVGINLHQKRASDAVNALRHALGRKGELIPVVTHSSIFQGQYEWGANDASSVKYETMAMFLQELRQLDVLVSDKLHVGLVAATLGVPFLSYQGKGKTRALHLELSLNQALVDEPRDLARKVEAIRNGGVFDTLVQAIHQYALDEQAMGHLHELQRMLKAAAG